MTKLRSVAAWILVAGVLGAAPISTMAQDRDAIDVSTLGPQVGETVPDFALPDQHGRMQTLESIMGERGAMIVFHRSADW